MSKKEQNIYDLIRENEDLKKQVKSLELWTAANDGNEFKAEKTAYAPFQNIVRDNYVMADGELKHKLRFDDIPVRASTSPLFHRIKNGTVKCLDFTVPVQEISMSIQESAPVATPTKTKTTTVDLNREFTISYLHSIAF